MRHAAKKTLNILFVDDDEKNYWRQRNWSENRAYYARHDPDHIPFYDVWVRSVSQAMGQLRSGMRFDGVITDLFLPYANGIPSGQPCGIAVVQECKRLSIPCVICTPYHHENEQLDWLRQTGLLSGAFSLVGMSDEYIKERFLREYPSEATPEERSEFVERIRQEQMATKDIDTACNQLEKLLRANARLAKS